MKLQTMNNGFLGNDEGINFEKPYKKAKAVIIPFGMESTVTYGKGTKNGPAAIIKASHPMEKLDEQSLRSFYKCGVATLKEPKIPKDSKQAIDLLAKTITQTLKDKKFPVVLGGEHSLTQGTVKGLCTKYSNFTLLQFDAHSDTRVSYRGSFYSHAAVMSQVLLKFPIAKLVQIGVRSLSDQNGELNFRKKNQNKIKTFWAWENIRPIDVVKAIPTKDVFISFDTDVFDPSVMPATGTPEPGGLLWWPVLDILKTVFEKKNVIGADVVELAPIKGLYHADFMIAKLVYKMIGYKFF
jgi:agmatinase